MLHDQLIFVEKLESFLLNLQICKLALGSIFKNPKLSFVIIFQLDTLFGTPIVNGPFKFKCHFTFVSYNKQQY
jgi:hypothetical protein